MLFFIYTFYHKSLRFQCYTGFYFAFCLFFVYKRGLVINESLIR